VKYFRLVYKGIDPQPLLAEIGKNEGAWLVNTSRQDKIRVQRETNTIFLRSAVARSDLNGNENQETAATKMSENFPLAMDFLTRVANHLNGTLSRATIVRLKPKSFVDVHIDTGSYYLIRDRFHFVLHSPSGSILQSGNERVRMNAGELWWFNNKQHHSSYNESDEWRIHYIFDILPPAFASLAINPLPIEATMTLCQAPKTE